MSSKRILPTNDHFVGTWNGTPCRMRVAIVGAIAEPDDETRLLVYVHNKQTGKWFYRKWHKIASPLAEALESDDTTVRRDAIRQFMSREYPDAVLNDPDFVKEQFTTCN